MSSIPYMPLYIADYMADAAHLSTLEHGAYLLLIMTYWQRGKPLPNSNERLANVARLSNEQWASVRPALCEFFFDDGETWSHKRIEMELARFRDKSAKASAAGKASAERRLNNRATDVKRTRNHTDTDTDTDLSSEGKPSSDKGGRKKLKLDDLSLEHNAAWLAEKRSQGKYLDHDEGFILEYFKNYCKSKGKTYADALAGYRNAFEWNSCQPKQAGGGKRTGPTSSKTSESLAALYRAGNRNGAGRPVESDAIRGDGVVLGFPANAVAAGVGMAGTQAATGVEGRHQGLSGEGHPPLPDDKHD